MTNEVKKEQLNVFGVVIGCKRLNVRKKPTVSSDAISVIDKDSEVLIDYTKTKRGWYSVCTPDGVNGFCMKKYIKIKS